MDIKVPVPPRTHSHRFIAEIGTAHNGDIVLAKELIDAAIDSGANVVKFQWVIAHEIVSPLAGHIKLPSGNIDINKSFKKVEHNRDFYIQIKEYSDSKQVEFLCSAFGFNSLHNLLELSLDTVKIASPEINYLSLLITLKEHIHSHAPNTHVILSDGVSTFIDIARVINLLEGIPTTIMRCVTQYPAEPSSYQLSRLPHYSRLFGCKVGVSDHTTHPYLVPVLAFLMGSSCTEKHFTLDHANGGLDDTFALTPDHFDIMVNAVKMAERLLTKHPIENLPLPNWHIDNNLIMTSARKLAQDNHVTKMLSILQEIASYFPIDDTSLPNNLPHLRNTIQDIIIGRGFTAATMPIYYTTRRSVFSGSTSIEKDILLDEYNTVCVRSETNLPPGIPAEYFPLIKGYSLKRSIAAHSPIHWEDLAMVNNI